MYTIKTIECQDADGNRGQEITHWVVEESDTEEIVTQLHADGVQATDAYAYVRLIDQFDDMYDVCVIPSDYLGVSDRGQI